MPDGRPTMLEVLEAVKRGAAPLPPVATLIGIRLGEVARGRVTMTLDTEPRHYNPMGTVHGGILCDLADAAMGTAFATTCDEGDSYATVDLTCNFLRPVWRSRLTAAARVVHRGRTIGLAECDVQDAQGRVVATLRSTLMVLHGEAARGRQLGEHLGTQEQGGHAT